MRPGAACGRGHVHDGLPRHTRGSWSSGVACNGKMSGEDGKCKNLGVEGGVWERGRRRRRKKKKNNRGTTSEVSGRTQLGGCCSGSLWGRGARGVAEGWRRGRELERCSKHICAGTVEHNPRTHARIQVGSAEQWGRDGREGLLTGGASRSKSATAARARRAPGKARARGRCLSERRYGPTSEELSQHRFLRHFLRRHSRLQVRRHPRLQKEVGGASPCRTAHAVFVHTAPWGHISSARASERKTSSTR
mmetsp:Transcript_105168/g.285566  ORF Transcript_105168/g.285566 Transcript_105168/m.285566 type:complete len:249 (-) Transcript_105168:431-1177(-)